MFQSEGHPPAGDLPDGTQGTASVVREEETETAKSLLEFGALPTEFALNADGYAAVLYDRYSHKRVLLFCPAGPAKPDGQPGQQPGEIRQYALPEIRGLRILLTDTALLLFSSQRCIAIELESGQISEDALPKAERDALEQQADRQSRQKEQQQGSHTLAWKYEQGRYTLRRDGELLLRAGWLISQLGGQFGTLMLFSLAVFVSGAFCRRKEILKSLFPHQTF